MSKYKVFSMFDGVGGFVVGLDNANLTLKEPFFETTNTNQFEPSRKSQDAFEVGVYNYPHIQHSNVDIMQVSNKYFEEMKAQGVNMIVGGFPCQDYSVARSKKHELGIEGKKGVLFWEIIRAVNHIKPEYLILENVDRLLKSPSSQRGRDLAIMLGAFAQLGYSVEWRVINAAEYGRAQRRRRVFFYVYRNDTSFALAMDEKYGKPKKEKNIMTCDEATFDNYIFQDGLFARQFPIEQEAYKKRHYSDTLSDKDILNEEYIVDISDNFTGTIWNTGIMRYGQYFTIDTEPVKEAPKTLGEIVREAKEYYVREHGEEEYNQYIANYQLDDDDPKLKKFEYLRGPKKIERVADNGHKYIFSEGGMSPYDSLDMPGRTMLTSEGSVNRSTHLLKVDGKYRLLTPIEAELLQDFPPDWTKFKKDSLENVHEVSDRMRLFFMGNALVTGIVERIGIELGEIVREYNTVEIEV
ncbi:DNA (cytosine-5-)-methyltransferase [Peribacillus simplex]|uniref:DNA (cytosine-5-)-methyltransferase n=1 Tax=Peribacillus simplex TaxID=1478 RepID=UPI0019244997|nr:DNA (cytosine-5-)-methyltransferase [Peribacillus simplex]MBD8590390.1 DNA (cytosine-5-)-methyltransferase [Peribacillus simplex]